MSDKKQLCVVFDIDETLIQFIPSKYKSLWTDMSPEMKRKFHAVDYGSSVVLIRPHLANLFKYFISEPNIKVGLWTYSEREYSEDMAGLLIKALKLPKDFFMFTWGAEDMESSESGMPKDLTDLYKAFPNFNRFNTFLVDDVYKNLNHKANRENCVLIPPFAPFGTEKVRTNIGEKAQTKMSKDNTFKHLKVITQKVLRDIMNCDEDDIRYAFTTESVFSEKRVKRMELNEYLQTYAVGFVKMFTIGKPETSQNFIMVNMPKSSSAHGVKTRKPRRKSRSNRTRHYRK